MAATALQPSQPPPTNLQGLPIGLKVVLCTVPGGPTPTSFDLDKKLIKQLDTLDDALCGADRTALIRFLIEAGLNQTWPQLCREGFI
jgi:hypothetical protein